MADPDILKKVLDADRLNLHRLGIKAIIGYPTSKLPQPNADECMSLLSPGSVPPISILKAMLPLALPESVHPMSMFQYEDYPVKTEHVKQVWAGANHGMYPNIKVPRGVHGAATPFPVCRTCKVNTCIGACGVLVHVSKCYYYRECAQIILSLEKLSDLKHLEPLKSDSELKEMLADYNLPLLKRLIEIRMNPVCLCLNTYEAIYTAS